MSGSSTILINKIPCPIGKTSIQSCVINSNIINNNYNNSYNNINANIINKNIINSNNNGNSIINYVNVKVEDIIPADISKNVLI